MNKWYLILLMFMGNTERDSSDEARILCALLIPIKHANIRPRHSPVCSMSCIAYTPYLMCEISASNSRSSKLVMGSPALSIDSALSAQAPALHFSDGSPALFIDSVLLARLP